MSRKGSILRKKNLASQEGPGSPCAGPLSDEQLQPSQVTPYDHDNKGCCKHDKSTQTEPVQIFPAEVIVQVVQELQPGMGVCPKCAGRRDGRDHNYTMDMTGLSIVRYKVKRCQCTRSPGSNPASKNLRAVNEEDGAEIECASADKEESAETENASADKEDTENEYTSVCKTEDAETDNSCDNHIQQQEEGVETSAGDTSCSSTGFQGHETVSVSYSDLELPIKMECEDVTFDYPGGNTGQTHTVLTVKEEATDELLNEINMATSWPGSTSEHVRGRKVCCAESDDDEVYPTKRRKGVKDSPSTSGSHQMPDYLHDAQYVVSFGDGKTSFLESEDEYGGSGKAPVSPGESSHQLELRAAEGGRPISQEGRTGVEPSGQQVPETSRIKVRGEAKPSQCEESAAEDHKQGARGERKSGRRTSTKHLHADTVYERWGVLENSTDAESSCGIPSSAIRGKYHRYTLQEKLAVIQEAKLKGVRPTALRLSIKPSTLFTWMKANLEDHTVQRTKAGRKIGSGKKVTYGYDLDEDIAAWILVLRDMQLPVTCDMLCAYARKVVCPEFPKFAASRGWLYCFLRRHELTLRTRTSISQKLPAQLEEKMTNFTSFVTKLRKEEELEDHLILNMDETPAYFDLVPGKTVGATEVHVWSTGSEKRHVTVVLTISASGIMLPPMVIFKGKDELKLTSPKGFLVCVQEKAWMNTDLMETYIKEIVKPYTKGRPSMMVLDSFRAHVAPEVKQQFKKANVSLAVIPGGCTSKLQPLDVCVNKPFKASLHRSWFDFVTTKVKECNYNQHVSIKVPCKQTLVDWIVEAFKEMNAKEELIKRSFKVTGITNDISGCEEQLRRNEEYLRQVFLDESDDEEPFEGFHEVLKTPLEDDTEL